MTLYDVSRTITNNAIVYPGDDAISMTSLCEVSPGCPCNMTTLGGWSTHILTHVDPPRHFFADGATLDDVPLDRFLGETVVVNVEGDVVTSEHVPDASVIAGRNLVFKTRNSSAPSDTFDESHVYLDASGATAAVEAGVNLVGIDYIGIDRFGDEKYPAHRTLLGANVLILEGLDLADIEPGEYSLMALPLRIAEGDGSPVRAVLISG